MYPLSRRHALRRYTHARPRGNRDMSLRRCAVLALLAVWLEGVLFAPASCKGGGSTAGGYSAGPAYSSTGKTTGKSWSTSPGTTRTSGGSTVHRPSSGSAYSNRPRYYNGGSRSSYGPRYPTTRTRTAQVAGAGFAVGWLGASVSRYSFYDKKHWCTESHTFRFGGSCRRCSTGPCPDGQYRVACSGGSDSYCTACNNVCTKFNADKSATATSTPPISVCLEDALPGSLNSSQTEQQPLLTCDPNKDTGRCTYTSDGTAAAAPAALSDCQIELCCNECTSDEDAIKKGYGTVCRGSVAGLTDETETAEIRYVAEIDIARARERGGQR